MGVTPAFPKAGVGPVPERAAATSGRTLALSVPEALASGFLSQETLVKAFASRRIIKPLLLIGCWQFISPEVVRQRQRPSATSSLQITVARLKIAFLPGS